jgi:hypothetical protein
MHIKFGFLSQKADVNTAFRAVVFYAQSAAG